MAKEKPCPELIGMKTHRQIKKMTREQLSEKTGFTVTMLNRYENGWSEPSLSKAKVIADALGCMVDDLF